MRVPLVLAIVGVALAGCVDETVTTPSVSVSYTKNTQTQNGVTTTSVDAKLTGVNGLSNWDELKVLGCTAPGSGPFNLPHQFEGCGNSLTIKLESTGETLYTSTG